jgi:lipoprotein-releasing system permease protein
MRPNRSPGCRRAYFRVEKLSLLPFNEGVLSFEFFHRFLISRRAGSLVKTISRISIAGIWLGVMALILVVSVMNGFNQSIRKRLLAVEPHLVIDFNDLENSKSVVEHPVYEQLMGLETELVAPISHQDVILRTSDGFVQHAVANGVTRERLLQLLEYANQKSGRVDAELKAKIENLGTNEMILGVGLADMIGLFREDTVVIIPPENLLLPSSEIPTLSQGTVKGFISTDVERIDGRSFYYILDQSFPRLGQTAGRSLAVEVWLQHPDQADTLKTQLSRPDIKVETWKERNASLFFALKIEKFVVSFLVGLSTMIAGLSIISVMVLLLTQKKKDVGNLLAMGMTKARTKNIFVGIGMFLALFGVLGGVISGVILALLVDRYSQDVLPAFYQETNIPTEIQLWQVATIVGIAVVFSYFALNVTMKRLSSFKPSEILRG